MKMKGRQIIKIKGLECELTNKKTSSPQIMNNTLDIGVTGQNYIPELYYIMDYTNFVNSIDLTFSTCQPKRIVSYFNVSRPFEWGF